MAEWCSENQCTAVSTSLKKTQEKFTEWERESLRELSEQKKKHDEMMRKNQEQLAALRESFGQLKVQADKNKAVMESKRNKVQTLRSDLQDVMSETDKLLREKEAAESELNQCKEELSKHKQMLAEQGLLTQRQQEDVEKTVSYFKDRLGLDIKKIHGNRLQVLFSCINSQKPEHIYGFCITVNPDRQYQVSECQPEIDDLEMLVTRLNETNNLRAFMLAVRTRFRDKTKST